MSNLKRILCPTDFSEPSYKALQLAIDFAAPAKTELTLLHVISPEATPEKQADPAGSLDSQRSEAHKNLENLIRDFKPEHVAMRSLVRVGDPTSGILAAAAAENSDLIVMATRGASGWREFVLGSVADEVVRLAHCPVLTVNTGIGAPAASIAPWLAPLQETPVYAKPGEMAEGPINGNAPAVAQATAIKSTMEDGFPADGSPEAKLRYLLSFAVLAPSNRNSQPWLWKVAGEELFLYADRSRALPHMDPDDRELILSCGASLEHLVIAMRHFGHRAEVQALPDPADADLMATIRLGDATAGADENDELFDAMFLRHTNRKPFQERSLPDALTNALRAEAVGEGARLYLVENAEKRMALINLIAKADLVQGRDALFLQETAGWIHPDQSGYAEAFGRNLFQAEPDREMGRMENGDGIPQYAMGNGGMLSRYNEDLGQAQADKDRLLAWCAPVLAILTTDDDRPRDWLAAGRALARVLLYASGSGVQASFFNSPVEVTQTWPQLHDVLGCAGLPQLIMRLGYPIQETGPTPRRAMDEVLI